MAEKENTHAEARLKSNNDPSRRVLDDVSPNVRPQPSAIMLNSKPLTGSPLKRSFTAAMEGGHGFQYLKTRKRKLSIDSPSSQVRAAPGSVFFTQGQLLPQWSPAVSVPQVCPTVLAPANHYALELMPEKNPLPEIQHVSPSEPTRPNTPAADGSPEEDDSQGANDRTSFSSLINYDPSSQTAPSSQHPTQPATMLKGPSYAELLRLRLRVAIFKVQTNQTHVRFEDLKVEQSPPAPPPNAFALLPSDKQSFPQLLSAPLLRPTAYSSRMLYKMPSSPPSGFSSVMLPRAGEAKTPRNGTSTAPDEQELTSSIVKDRVAEGLLGLRNAV